MAGFVVADAGVSPAFVVRGRRWHTAATQFASMAAINAGTVVTFVLIRQQLQADLNLSNTLFLV